MISENSKNNKDSEDEIIEEKEKDYYFIKESNFNKKNEEKDNKNVIYF